MRHIASTRFRIGIGGTLSIAFVAVAILAAAANLISERGLDVVAESEVLPVAETFVVTLPASPMGPPVSPDASHTLDDPTSLLPSLDVFDRLVQRRVLEQSTEAEVQLRNAAKALETERDNLLQLAKDRDGGKERAGFGAAVQAHIADGTALVGLADASRLLLTNYADRYNAMRARARSSIDRAWKVFGRVVARQSLITLNREIEELGARSIALGTVSRSDSALISEAISTIAATLAKNERGLASSQGKEWLAAMNDDLAYLSSTHTTILASRDRQRELQNRFALIRSQLTESSMTAFPNQRSSAPQAPDAPLVQPPTPISPTHAHVSRTTYQRSAIIAWVSAGVLLMLVIVSAATVRSVVGPVRRLVNATDRLAEGEMDVRVRAGGIKELDTLAVAFNSMAERLAQAERTKREYQQHLEAKVEERTQQLKHLASHDPLTSLPNHRQLFVLLNDALQQAESSKTMTGVYFIDIDNFKNINDGMGHAYGDKVLKAMAQRLQEVASEFGFAARLGGDEFTVVIDRATTEVVPLF